jgi:hypothetical protein
MDEMCIWPVSYEACGATPGDPDATPPVAASTGCSALDSLSDDAVAGFERMAAELLWNWTGRIFGVCELSVRPCRSGCSSAARWMNTFWGRGPYPWGAGAGSWVPLLIGGEWFNMGCGCAGTCSCSESGPSSLRLPGPITEVVSVRVDGVPVPSSAYEVMYGRNLVRRDGGVWPACQDLLLNADQPGTFEVVYRRGVAVPLGGQIAAGVLACELAKAACNDNSCQLPQRLQTVTRQGMTVGIVDSFQGLGDGKTGIWLIDSWTSSIKGQNAKGFAGVRSPDFKPRSGGARSW